ncbi:MAG: aspartate 1-decarboxylase [Actinomycetaceae bacterium]|nr:aspartate 1-decarboxylase [Actinomycetaceae bacterium]
MSSEIYRTLMSGKIHRATVTGADLNYVGSITVDSDLLEAAGILEGERVDIVNVTNGNRLSTYTIAGTPGSGVIQLNGAAAHLTDPGDIVIIIAYQSVPESLTANFKGRVVLVDENNRILSQDTDPGSVPEGLENATGGPKPLKSPNRA